MNKQIGKRMVSPAEAAVMFGLAPGTLGNWRSARKGPRFFKVNRKVLYQLEDLENFFTQTPVLTMDSRPEPSEK